MVTGILLTYYLYKDFTGVTILTSLARCVVLALQSGSGCYDLMFVLHNFILDFDYINLLFSFFIVLTLLCSVIILSSFVLFSFICLNGFSLGVIFLILILLFTIAKVFPQEILSIGKWHFSKSSFDFFQLIILFI